MKKLLFLIIFIIISFGGILGYQYVTFNDGKLHVIFCDVQQGDGILIKTPTNKYVLIDAGPDDKIIDCLSKHMPIWEREIDLAIVTHPHADHFMGYYYVIDRYIVVQLATENLVNNTDGFKGLTKLLEEKNIPIQYAYAGDIWRINDVNISVVGPTKEFIERKDPDGVIDNSAESASLAILVNYKDFTALLTGDAPVDEMQEVARMLIEDLDVLQIPHHGSDTGIDAPVLDLLAPNLAVISVGKNDYGHPTQRVLDLLTERNIKVARTDQIGDVEIVSDGKETKF